MNNVLILAPQKPLETSIALERPLSMYAVASVASLSVFLVYIGAYRPLFSHSLPSQQMILGFGSLIVAPALALIFSAIALRQSIQRRMPMRGVGFAYASFLVSAFYIATICTLPLFLIFFYIIYAYIW